VFADVYRLKPPSLNEFLLLNFPRKARGSLEECERIKADRYPAARAGFHFLDIFFSTRTRSTRDRRKHESRVPLRLRKTVRFHGASRISRLDNGLTNRR